MAETKEQEQVFDIPKTCKAGVVVNEGPDFRVEVRDVPVPEISTCPQRCSRNHITFRYIC
jgi:hypothetical protein